jgi:hypothetical protein
MNPIRNWINPTHVLTKCSLKICFIVIYFYISLSPNWSLSINFAKQYFSMHVLPFLGQSMSDPGSSAMRSIPDDWSSWVWIYVLDHSVDSLQSTPVHSVQFSAMYSSLASRSVGLIYASTKLLNWSERWNRWMCLLNSRRFYLRFCLRFVSSVNNRHVG